MQATVPFWDIHLGDVGVMGTMAIALAAYLYSRKQDGKDVSQRHAENAVRLDTLLAFRIQQEATNSRRDEQITQLKILAESQAQISKSQDRRLEMLEDEIRTHRP